MEKLKREAAAIAEELKNATEVSPPLRDRLIALRAALFQLGVFDPILARFDSATVPHPTISELATELIGVASSLRCFFFLMWAFYTVST